MSGMNYAKAKQERQARSSSRATPDTASTNGWNGSPVSLRGWRTEWDGEPFPVTVTTVEQAEEPRVACA